MIERAAVVEEARRWLGTPYQHQAALRVVACDCIGLVLGVARALGLPEADAFEADIRFRAYAPLPDPAKLLSAAAVYMLAIESAAAGLGDVLLMTFMREPMHFGFVSCVQPRRMIHAYAQRGAVVEHGIDAKWARRVVGAYRLRGVA